MTKFDGAEYVSKIERIREEHMKAGKKWFTSCKVERLDDDFLFLNVTVESEIIGSVSISEPWVGEIEDVHDRALFKALSLLGY